MSEAKKDFAYYQKHPEEWPTDVKEIERLASEHMDSAMSQAAEVLTVDRFVEPADKPAEEKPKAEPKAEEEKEEAKLEEKVEAKSADADGDKKSKALADAKTRVEAGGGQWIDGVLSVDGKQVLPYPVLKTARERASAAEALIAEKDKEIERLKGEKLAGKPAAEEAKPGALTEDELTALEADSPTLANILREQQRTIQKLNETVQSIAKSRDEEAKAEEADVKSEIQSAIDATPTLAAWQADKDQTMWNEASKFDKLLRENPKYADVPFEDRFAKVVELTQAALGLEVERQAPKEEPKLTQEEVKAAAEAKLKAKPSLPRSLSDIPGGAPPAVDERQKVEQMSSVALGQAFLGMTKDQMDAYLSSL